jgi:phosphate transport system permease protein
MEKKFLQRIKRRDRVARWVITVGGMGIIASVLLILLLIAQVTFPLFQRPQSQLAGQISLPTGPGVAAPVATGLDEYLESAFVLRADGSLHYFDLDDGSELASDQLEPPAPGAQVLAAENLGHLNYSLSWSDGSLTLDQLKITPQFDGAGERSLERELQRKLSFPPLAEAVRQSLGRLDSEGRQTRVALLENNRILVEQRLVSVDFLGNETAESSSSTLEEAAAGSITALALDHQGKTLYAGTASGLLLRWDLSTLGSPQLLDNLQAFADGRKITALGLVFGDISLAVGDERGEVSTWFPVAPNPGEEKQLRLIHRLARHTAPITAILPSQRDKCLLSLDSDGHIHLDHMTSERHLLGFEAALPLQLFGFAGRGDGLVAMTAAQELLVWRVDNPHPEVSWRTLFEKVWYESYEEPALVWQSSSASDDFEQKLSLTPLIFGTLKGTFYAMLLAVPLALLGAIYTSQFGNARLRGVIKPTVEIMAAIPSVIIGFLAALWLAPLIEKSIVALFLSFILIPASFVLSLLFWQWLRQREGLRRIEKGYEFLALAPVLVLAVAIAWVLGPLLEQLLFAGDFKLWLFNEAGVRYDPRNSIIISFALGFAVIPIIFTIAEDALSNVPTSLKAASLALGASRWQTVWRVILPSASPGIFAAVMIGFGRAIGETMIVLMATGNTPIMDWSMFNGMRPLSANIAVEIPEAPVGGTLFRVLFLSAVILFIITFVLNTVAEVVRQNLRKKYGRF